MEMQQNIIKNVLKEDTDFIAYVNLDTEEIHTIMTNENCSVVPPLQGDYSAIIEESVSKLVHPDDREECQRELSLANIQKQLEQRERFELLYRLWCGSEYRRKIMIIHYYDHTRNILVLVSRDVTENYLREQRARDKIYQAMTKAQKVSQEKNEFLERMSHEIRTPMNSIIGLTYLSKENIGNQKQLLENLDKIEMSACFLRSFIDDILNLSLLESGRVANNDENIDFALFLNDLEEWGRNCAQEKHLSFSMQVRGSFADEYYFDGEKLREALMNILNNAVKYTQTGGEVAFIAERLQDHESETICRFEIRDSGIGMERTFLTHVFDVFEQENTQSTTLYGGMGLGLTISKNIIDFMNGKIDVYSEKGKGSTFVVTVPLQRTKDHMPGARKHSNTSDLEYDFAGKRVLLVEDNEINIEITKNILVHKNFEVEVALNGKEGVECFQNHEAGYYDAILMDIRMPVMDGLTATERIRNSQRADGSVIPIVAMTANAFEEDVRKSLEAGMDAHLSKPVDIHKMYALLDSIIFG